MNALHPKKLLLTKWTAVQPISKNKHFLVSKVIQPDPPALVIEWVELEAVYSKAVIQIDWRALRDESIWRQGWVSGWVQRHPPGKRGTTLNLENTRPKAILACPYSLSIEQERVS